MNGAAKVQQRQGTIRSNLFTNFRVLLYLLTTKLYWRQCKVTMPRGEFGGAWSSPEHRGSISAAQFFEKVKRVPCFLPAPFVVASADFLTDSLYSDDL